MDIAAQGLTLLAEAARQCSLCRLCESRTQAVPGTGNPNPDIVFIGEAPGKNEDEQGVPFCGASGKLLDSMLESIDLSRSDVFITNIVKCRPPKNRDPLPAEKEVCATTYLDRQLELLRPKITITLGRHSLNHFFPNLKISEAHGRPIFHQGKAFLPLYHPAAALYNGSMRAVLVQDFQAIPSLLNDLTTRQKPIY